MAVRINAMRDNLPKSFEYQGIVIASLKSVNQDQNNLVLLLKSESEYELEKIVIYGVLSCAFVPPAVEDDFLKVEFAKNLERRYATPLGFGDTVMWNDCDCDHTNRTIRAFRRDKPFYQVKTNEWGAMLRIGGVINPATPATFWTRLGFITIPVSESTKAEPDVYLFAWIRVETKMFTSFDPVDLTFTFDHFDCFEVSEQTKVSEAPWHRKSLESRFNKWYAEPDLAEEDYAIAVEEPKDVVKIENKWAEKIRKQLGLYVGERLLLCKDLPQYDFIIPLVGDLAKQAQTQATILPTNGEYFFFQAMWSSNHMAYLVTDMMPVLSLRGHQVTPNGNLCIRVVPSKSIRGFFEEQANALGLIDDPHHVVTFLEFHPACHSNGIRATVEVYAVRCQQNRSVRYRVVRPILDDDQMLSFWDWRDRNDVAIGPISGMLISRDTAVSAQHPNIFFRLTLGEGENPPAVGAGIRFRAKRSAEFLEEAAITEWHLEPRLSAQKLYHYEEGIRLFQLPLKALGDHDQLAVSEAVGPVDMRHFNHPHQTRGYLAWVRESPLVGDCRRAATVFEVCGLAESVPIIPIHERASSKATSSYRSGLTSASQSECGGSRSSISSRISNISSRFAGPSSSTSTTRVVCPKNSEQSGCSSAGSSLK